MDVLVIQNKIYEIRGHKVMLDFDLAHLYEVENRALKQAVKRNLDRFPDDFMFQLNENEVEQMVSQNVIPSKSYFGGALPFAFTEQGVAMLSSVLKSKKALQVNIAIIRVFVEVRKSIVMQKDILQQLEILNKKIGEHDSQFNSIYEAIENLLDQKAEQKTWENREPIGFIKPKKKK